MVEIFVVPIAAIAAIIFFSLLGMMLWMRQRRRERTVFVPPLNRMPMQPIQPMNFNPVNPVNPYPVNPVNPYPVNPYNPYPTHPTSLPYPMPIPQPPTPITVPTTTPPNPATSDSDLMDRMRQVQSLMVEIHRLEGDSREGSHQRLQELKQRVAELSVTDGRMPPGSDSLQPPPAYLSDVKHSIGRPDDGAGRGY